MKRKLTMDDVREGMYITVLRGKIEQRVFPMPDGPELQFKEHSGLNGKILEVIALDLPYIVVTCYEPLGSRTMHMDLREIEVITLTPEYIHAIMPKLKLRKDSYWKEVDSPSLERIDKLFDKILKEETFGENHLENL